MQNLTKIDWLGFRCGGGVDRVVEALASGVKFDGIEVAATPRAHGWMGYESSAELAIGGMRVGLLAWGGEAQRGWISTNVTGRGCEWFDMQAVQEAAEELPSYQLRRVDIALDTKGREVTHEKVVAAYRDGLFSSRGRPPHMSRVETEEGDARGRTIYIGSRSQAKFLRCYEKGYELCKGFPASVMPTHVDDVPIGDLYRLELELKAKLAPLPEDLIDRRDQYFAGAYPYLQRVLEVEPEIFVQRREAGPQRDLRGLLATVRQQYGATLFTALAAHHGDITAVWDQVCGNRHNQALVEAGVLLVDHDSL